MEEGYMEEELYEEDDMAAEAPAEMPAEAPAGGDAEDMATRLVKAIASAITAETGIPVGVEGDGAAAPAAPADDLAVEEPPAEEAPAEEAPADVEALAETVLRRVMKRVNKLNESRSRKANLSKRVDEVTDRIMRRITR